MLRRVLITVAVLTWLAAIRWYGLHWLPADFSYALKAQLESVPPDDESLAQ